jgi:hypothetical protein
LEGYMTTKEAAEKWNLSVRQVQNHCKLGRIKGVERVGKAYLIPITTQKPVYTFVCESILPDEKDK